MDEPDFEVTDLRTGLPDERVYAHDDERQAAQAAAGCSRDGAGAARCASCCRSSACLALARRCVRRCVCRRLRPAPSLALGGDIVYFEHGLPWGTLLMDGKLVTNVESEQPYTGFEAALHVLSYPLGRHLLEYRAPLFPTLHCWISVPAARSDTCPLVHDRSVQDVTPPFPAERVLNLGGDPASLSPDLRASLVVRGARGPSRRSRPAPPSRPVIPSPMRTARHRWHRASMTATLSYAIATDPGTPIRFRGTPTVAPSSALFSPPRMSTIRRRCGSSRRMFARMDIYAGNGAAFLGSAAPQGILPDSIVPLSVTWNGAWHVRSPIRWPPALSALSRSTSLRRCIWRARRSPA